MAEDVLELDLLGERTMRCVEKIDLGPVLAKGRCHRVGNDELVIGLEALRCC